MYCASIVLETLQSGIFSQPGIRLLQAGISLERPEAQGQLGLHPILNNLASVEPVVIYWMLEMHCAVAGI